MRTIKDGSFSDKEIWDEKRVPDVNDIVDVFHNLTFTDDDIKGFKSIGFISGSMTRL